MTRYVTLFGHTEGGKEDVPLSALGREQAGLLAERLARLEFRGVIITSPSKAALETAEIIAEALGVTIEASENLMDKNGEAGRGAEAAALADEKYPESEVLFVCDGKSADALIKHFNIRERRFPLLFHCSLSAVGSELKEVNVYCNTDYIPYGKTCRADYGRSEYDRMLMEADYDLTLPPEVTEMKGPRVLHIGDTDSYRYPYYRRLIEITRPDVIVHTGDLADEVKIGRKPEVYDEYVYKLGFLAKMLIESGARLILVPGNNDLPKVVAELIPEATVYSENTVIDLFGVETRISHRVMNTTFDREITLYGHGYTGDDFRPDMNRTGQPMRFNACETAFLFNPESREFHVIPVPQYRY